MNFDDEDLATYYPGKYIRKKDKRGRFFYRDRDTGKPVSKKTWEQERLAILQAVEKRKKEKEEGKKPQTKIPAWVSPERKKKKEISEKKKVRSKKWEEERKKQAKEVREAREKLKKIEIEYRKEQERIGRAFPPISGIAREPTEKTVPPEVPEEIEEIEYFDVDEVNYSSE